MTHVMLDLETLGTGNDAVVVSIGACIFDPHRINVKDSFYRNVGDWNGQQTRGGRKLDGDTVGWWFTQSDEARRALLTDQCSPEQALNDFADFIQDLDVEVWGNGADFDNVILGNMYAGFGKKRPWSFGRNRCFRTMKNLPVPKDFVKPTLQGTQHNALNDAVYQAVYLQAIYKALKL